MKPVLMLAIRRMGLMAASAVLLGACATAYVPGIPVQAPLAVVQAPRLQAGDTWVYVQKNGYNGLPVRTLTDTLKAAPQGFVVERRSDQPADSLQSETISAPWRQLAETSGSSSRSFSAPLARIAFPISPGQSWQEEAQVTDERGVKFRWRTTGHALGWERIRTGAGEFVALRIERQMNLGDYDYTWSDTRVVETYWYAPEVKRWVRFEHRYERVELLVGRVRRPNQDWIVWELTAFSPAATGPTGE